MWQSGRLSFMSIYNIAATLLAATALGLTMWTTVRNNALARASNAARQVAAGSVLSVGDSIQRVVGVALNGRRRVVEIMNGSGTRTLLIGVSATCEFCEQSVPVFRHISTIARGAGMQVLLVSRDDPNATMANALFSPFASDFVAEPTNDTWHAMRLAYVPQTSIVSSTGKVERTWLGALDIGAEHEIAGAIAGK